MSSEIKVNSIQDKTGTRVLASDSGSAWSWGSGVPDGMIVDQYVYKYAFSSNDTYNHSSGTTTILTRTSNSDATVQAVTIVPEHTYL